MGPQGELEIRTNYMAEKRPNPEKLSDDEKRSRPEKLPKTSGDLELLELSNR